MSYCQETAAGLFSPNNTDIHFVERCKSYYLSWNDWRVKLVKKHVDYPQCKFGNTCTRSISQFDDSLSVKHLVLYHENPKMLGTSVCQVGEQDKEALQLCETLEALAVYDMMDTHHCSFKKTNRIRTHPKCSSNMACLEVDAGKICQVSVDFDKKKRSQSIGISRN